MKNEVVLMNVLTYELEDFMKLSDVSLNEVQISLNQLSKDFGYDVSYEVSLINKVRNIRKK